jgi:hypothetical protein
MSVLTGTSHTVFDDPAIVVGLMTINESVVNAHIGESTTEQQRVYFQSPQQNLKIGTKKS